MKVYIKSKNEAGLFKKYFPQITNHKVCIDLVNHVTELGNRFIHETRPDPLTKELDNLEIVGHFLNYQASNQQTIALIDFNYYVGHDEKELAAQIIYTQFKGKTVALVYYRTPQLFDVFVKSYASKNTKEYNLLMGAKDWVDVHRNSSLTSDGFFVDEETNDFIIKVAYSANQLVADRLGMQRLQKEVLSMFGKLNVKCAPFDPSVNQFIVDLANATVKMSATQNNAQTYLDLAIDTNLLLNKYENLVKTRNKDELNDYNFLMHPDKLIETIKDVTPQLDLNNWL